MFHFEATLLAHLFFGLSLLVILPLLRRRDLVLHLLLLLSLGILFYASSLATLFIGWEMMGWSSYFILASSARVATLQRYILFNLGGAFALLGAIALLYGFMGSLEYRDIDASLLPPWAMNAIALLLFVAVFVKSGIIGLHDWVVDSYSEATPLFSAILSAILSKAGIYLFIVMFMVLLKEGATEPLLFEIMAWLGVITSIVATFKAISQDEMRRLLAYSSIAQIGYIITILALMQGFALEAALYHTLIHTLIKLLLFMNIASIIAITQKERFSELGGMIYHAPVLFLLLVIGIIALAGMPLLGGFNSKFLIYTALLEEKRALLLGAVMFSSASAFLYCYKLVYGIYLGQRPQEASLHVSPKSYYLPQLLSAALLVLLALLPSLPVGYLSVIGVELGFAPLDDSNLFILQSAFGSFHGGALMGAFGVAFVALLGLLQLAHSKAKKVKDPLDISYCGEVPRSETNLHFGYGMGYELHRISFIAPLLRHHSRVLWDRLSLIASDFSALLSSLYSLSAQHVTLLALLLFTLLLLGGQ
ncbi:MAG: hypothetical protein JXK05_03165 [Campylobacterales bacterium]|nr:hypothetical protein [Campylobacterales bacterium]